MSREELKLLVGFRLKYPDLSWDDLGRLFGVTGVEAREEWLVYTDYPRVDGRMLRPAPLWWRAARDLSSEGRGPCQIARSLGRNRKSVEYALGQMAKMQRGAA
jgi:hypothetical protein